MTKGRVEGKVALITGAASGIGRATTIRLAAEGARVLATDLNEDGLKETCRLAGASARAFRHDVAREDDWIAAIAKTREAFGRLDILGNIAGVARLAPLAAMTLEEWRFVLGINLDGVFLGIKHAMPAMGETGGGSIVNISSVLGMVGRAGVSAYCASKGGVRLLTKSAAHEGAVFKVRVNSIHPGFIETPMIRGDLDPAAMAERRRMLLKEHPIGFLGEPEDVAGMVLYLASDEARFVTGAEFAVDGGFTAH
jgi:NAD(P)-dependent dehydrogenase (short-subunit alcohol dehydrogenase family)